MQSDYKNNSIKSFKDYEKKYSYSIENSDEFWAVIAERISWYQKWSKVSDNDYSKGKIKWYEEGKLNVSYNCLDRHIENGKGDECALIWEGNDPAVNKKYSYKELLIEVSKFANVLKSNNILKGDRVCIYMQMVPELTIAMLACARIGAVHSIVFGAFSSDSLKERINDSQCKAVITQDTGVRGMKKNIPMKDNVDKALAHCPSVKNVFVVQRTKTKINMNSKDQWWHVVMEDSADCCVPEIMDSEDPLFILYTSGSTGKPKGVLHTTGGYLVYASYTHEVVFNYKPGEIYWCTADIGWITGHSYIVYGPLSNQATTLIFEGVPNYPDFSRFWKIIDKHNVNIFYTAPTALRAFKVWSTLNL